MSSVHFHRESHLQCDVYLRAQEVLFDEEADEMGGRRGFGVPGDSNLEHFDFGEVHTVLFRRILARIRQKSQLGEQKIQRPVNF